MDPKLKKVIEQTENLARQIRSLKSKIRRRQKKCESEDLTLRTVSNQPFLQVTATTLRK